MRMVLAFVLVAAAAVSVRADDSARPDPRELLRKANEAAANLRAISYHATFLGEGVVSKQVPSVSGKIIAQRGTTPDRTSVRIEGTFSDPGSRNAVPVKFATNGTKAYRIDDTQKIFISGNAGDANSPEMSALLPPKYLADAPYRMDLTITEVTHEGVEDVNGVACDKVKVMYDPTGGAAMIYWFGREDHLVRRLENHMRVRVPGRPEPESGRIIFSVTDLDASPSINGDTFSFTAPEGYREETFAPKPRMGKNNLLAPGGPAPDWELKTAQGKTVSLKSLRGKVVVMDFWASWCGPCKIAMPGIEKLHQRFKDKPVEVIGINCRQRHAPITDAYKVIEDLGLTYTQLFGGDQVAESYIVGGIPCLYLIGPDGNIAWAVSGWQPNLDEMLANMITEILKANEKTAEADKKE